VKKYTSTKQRIIIKYSYSGGGKEGRKGCPTHLFTLLKENKDRRGGETELVFLLTIIAEKERKREGGMPFLTLCEGEKLEKGKGGRLCYSSISTAGQKKKEREGGWSCFCLDKKKKSGLLGGGEEKEMCGCDLIPLPEREEGGKGGTSFLVPEGGSKKTCRRTKIIHS